MKRWAQLFLPPLVVFVVLTAVAQWYIGYRQLPTYLLPKPTQVFSAIVSEHESLLASLAKTALAAGIGFVSAAIIGILLAIILSSAKIVQRAFYPYMIFFQTVPVVAIAPLLVIWFEAGLKSVAICSFIVSVFPVIANTLSGLLSTDPALSDMFKLYGANAVARLWKLRLPSAAPNIVTGLRIAAGLSVIGTIVGEFVATELDTNAGLGVLIATNSRYGQTPMVFAALLAASALGLVMLCIVNLLGYVLLRKWHASEQ